MKFWDKSVDKKKVGRLFTPKKKLRKEIYLEYIKIVHEVCRTRLNEVCSDEAMRTLLLDSNEVKKCVAETFDGSDFERSENSFLATLSEQW